MRGSGGLKTGHEGAGGGGAVADEDEDEDEDEGAGLEALDVEALEAFALGIVVALGWIGTGTDVVGG